MDNSAILVVALGSMILFVQGVRDLTRRLELIASIVDVWHDSTSTNDHVWLAATIRNNTMYCIMIQGESRYE